MTPNDAFYVYVHTRPDGSPFYVGKGNRRRAYDFAPSRRTAHHRNIIAKHGLKNVAVHLISTPTEADAFELEVFMIEVLREHGVGLCNITSGGEGASMPATPEKIEGLNRGRDTRWRGKQYALALKGGERQCHCVTCGVAFMAQKGRKACSKKCEQIEYRSRTQVRVERIKTYKNNTTGCPGVFKVPTGKHIANIGIGGKLIHLGTFSSFEDARDARLAAEARYADEWNGGIGVRSVSR